MSRRASALETVFVDVPGAAVPAYEAALRSVCDTVGLFADEAAGLWRVEGVKQAGKGEGPLRLALALADAATGAGAVMQRHDTEAEGWLARTASAFPEQRIGRFVVRGTHLSREAAPGRIALVLDAGAAFGSGEHGSTRGCLRALERVAHRRPRRILDLGTGSGILGLAAARLLHRPVLAVDIDPWAVRVAACNVRLNGARPLVRVGAANGLRQRRVRACAPYDLVLANILARPLAAMARDMAAALAPGGVAILSGLLQSQTRLVLTAYAQAGLRLSFSVLDGTWTTLVLRKGNFRN